MPTTTSTDYDEDLDDEPAEDLDAQLAVLPAELAREVRALERARGAGEQ